MSTEELETEALKLTPTERARLAERLLAKSGEPPWHDARAFGAAVTLILAISVLAVLIPLRRANRITPLEALGSH